MKKACSHQQGEPHQQAISQHIVPSLCWSDLLETELPPEGACAGRPEDRVRLQGTSWALELLVKMRLEVSRVTLLGIPTLSESQVSPGIERQLSLPIFEQVIDRWIDDGLVKDSSAG
ncbi:hypothetical protein WJX84_009339 [Apatococcus fuscideae]|uniref:Uncharacterized protein n=1 Tax=Apatococcus fuscideae TaxID=2026836 RepID=A0AAW1SW14_9CHLO